MSQPEVLIVPGLGGSGPGHWQTAWERERAVARAVRPVLLVAPADVDSLSLLGDWPHGPRLLGEPGMAVPGVPA